MYNLFIVIEQLRHVALKFDVSASLAPPRNRSWRRHYYKTLNQSINHFIVIRHDRTHTYTREIE